MDKKIIYFSSMMKKKLSNHLKELILFGSRARGDNHESSDYDFLVILDVKNKELIKKVREIEVDFLNQYDNLSASIIMNPEEWEKSKNLPIGINISKDGVRL